MRLSFTFRLDPLGYRTIKKPGRSEEEDTKVAGGLIKSLHSVFWKAMAGREVRTWIPLATVLGTHQMLPTF